MRISSFVILWFLILLFSFKAKAAEDLSSQAGINKKELIELMSSHDQPLVFQHKQWGPRNPFDTGSLKNAAPKLQGPAAVKDFVLEGIFLGSEKPSVIINGVVAGVGDSVKGAVVKEIKDNAVTLIDDKGNSILLQLRQ